MSETTNCLLRRLLQAFSIVQGRIVKGIEAREVIMTELTKAEFAEALGLKPESSFMEHMFNVVDKDHNGLISFREFLDMILLFSKGQLFKSQTLFY